MSLRDPRLPPGTAEGGARAASGVGPRAASLALDNLSPARDVRGPLSTAPRKERSRASPGRSLPPKVASGLAPCLTRRSLGHTSAYFRNRALRAFHEKAPSCQVGADVAAPVRALAARTSVEIASDRRLSEASFPRRQGSGIRCPADTTAVTARRAPSSSGLAPAAATVPEALWASGRSLPARLASFPLPLPAPRAPDRSAVRSPGFHTHSPWILL